ncbi:MAG: ABC-2 family transporter protein [Phycisphaerae bacterium]|nr:ABC-2 family transporter protein [Phycisphaerae bacterium]
MPHTLRAYPSLFRVAWTTMFQYRAEMLIWAAWGFVHPLVALAVWSAAAHGRTIVGLGRADFAAYFLTLMIFSHLTMSWDAFEFSYLVQSGRLSPKLLRPIHPIHEAIAYNIAYKLITLLLLVPVWLLILWALHPNAATRAWHLAAVVPVLLLGAAVRFLWNYCIALVAFWTTKVDAINSLYWSFDQFLGGRLAPMALMPAFVQTAAWFAPFRSMVVFPVEVALGQLNGRQILEGLAMQLVWLVLGYGLFRLLWRLGIRQYSAVGA